MEIHFYIMDGAGNRFVILDGRSRVLTVDEAMVQMLSSPQHPVTSGCDQLIVLESPDAGSAADVGLQIFNADGGEVSACGNATRCIADLLMREQGKERLTIATKAGVLEAWKTADGIWVDMGLPRTDWQEIPLSKECDTSNILPDERGLKNGVAVSMGNPHAVFFVPSVDAIDLESEGAALEHHPLFPERANISIVEVQDAQTVKARVWERGVGETQACGTGACAIAVAAHQRGLTGREVQVHLPGGVLPIYWRKEDDHVLMSGPVTLHREGVL